MHHEWDKNCRLARRAALHVSHRFASRCTCASFVAVQSTDKASIPLSNLFCRHPWLLAWPCATNLGLSRSPAAHAPDVRSGRSCHAPPTRPGSVTSRPAVGFGWSSHTRLRQPACAVCLRPRAQPTLRRRLAYWKRCRGRVIVARHARPAAHTLRVVVRSAALSGSYAPVQSISQRGRQRHAASPRHTATACRQQHVHQHCDRHATAPTSSHHRDATDPLESLRTCSTSSRKRAPDSLTCDDIRLAEAPPKPMPTCNKNPPETRPSDPRAPTQSPCCRWSC